MTYRRLAALGATAALAAATLAPSSPAARIIVDDVVHGPICADIGTNPFAVYDGQVLTFVIGTATTDAVPENPTCKRVKYTLHVLDERTDTTEIATKTLHGTWTVPGELTFTIPVVDPDGIVWVYATTQIRTGPTIDRAPDLFAVDVAVGGVPDARSMR